MFGDAIAPRVALTSIRNLHELARQLTPDHAPDEELDDLAEFLREEYQKSDGQVPVENFEARLELRVLDRILAQRIGVGGGE